MTTDEFGNEDEESPDGSEQELTPVSLDTTEPPADEDAPLPTGEPEVYQPQEAPKTYGGIPEATMNALVWQESKGNPNAVSKRGAMGLGQIMPAMWKSYGQGGDPFDPDQNKEASGKILSDELSRFSGNQELAFAAYNAGSPQVIRALKKAGYSLRDAGEVPFEAIKEYLPDETQSYVPSVMGRIKQNTLREPNAYESSGAASSVPPSDDPRNVGNADYLKKKVQGMLSSPGFEDTTATEKLTALREIWSSKPYWDEESKPLFKQLSTVAWEGAGSSEQIDYGELAGETPLLKGKNEKEQNDELQSWKNEKDEELVKMGINPLFLGDQWDNYFKEAGKSEKQAKSYRDRGMLGQIAGYPLAAAENIAQGFGSGVATTLSAVPRLAGFEETAEAIDAMPSKLLPTPRRDFNYEVDELGRLVTDEYGNPVTKMQGTITGALGAVASFLLPTTALKLAGAPRYALQALNISTMSLQGANTAYQDAINNGGDRNQALLSAALAVPINTADSLVNLQIIAGGKAWLNGLGPLNKARAVGWQFMKEGSVGGSANALASYLQDVGVSAVIGKDITSGRRVFDQFVGGFVATGAVGASQATYVKKPDAALRDVTPEEHAKLKTKEPTPDVPPKVVPTELPKETEHERLTKAFEGFQRSPDMEMITNLRSPADLDPEHLALFGYKAEQLPNGKVKITKETTFQAPDISAMKLGPLHNEITKLSNSLEKTPHFDTFPEVQTKYAELTDKVKEWGPDTYEQARKAKEYLNEQDSLVAKLQELKSTKGETRQAQELINKAIADTKQRLIDLLPFSDADAPGVKEAKTLRDLETANQQLKAMQDPRYANDLMAKDNHLKQLVLRRHKLDAERAAGGMSKEAGGEPKEIDIPLGIPVGTKQGMHSIVPHENKWHLFNKDNELVADGFSTYGEALKFAKELSKTGRVGLDSRMEGEAAAAKPNAELLSNSARFGEIEKAQAEWTTKQKQQAGEALADLNEAERLQKRIDTLTEREGKAKGDEAKAAIRRNIEEHQKLLDEANNNLKDDVPGVKEAKLLKEKKVVADNIKKLTGRGPGTGEGVIPTKSRSELPGELWAEGEPTEKGKAAETTAKSTVDKGAYTSPMRTRQPQKAPNVPLDSSFIPGKLIAATETKEVSPREVVATGRKILKNLSNLKRQATSAGYSVFGGAGRRLRTPEEAIRLQQEHPLDFREGGRGIGKHVLGFIDYLQRFIRSDNYNDFPTIAHEITHAINTELFPEWSAFPQKLQEGLVKMGRAFYGDPGFDKYPLTKKLNEGWATFMEHYTSGQTVQKDVLDFYNGWLKDTYPTLHTDIETLKAKMEDYYKMDPYTYAKVFMGAMPLKKPTLISGTEFLDKWVDQGIVTKEMQKLSGDKTKIGDLFEANKGRAGEVASNLVYGKGFKGWENDEYIGGMSGEEAIAPAKGRYPELAAYMLAKRTLALGKRGKRAGFAMDDAAKIVHDIEVASKNDYGDAVMRAHENLMNWYLNVMKMAASRSPYLQESVDRITQYNRDTTGTDHGYYMPMVREIGDAVKDYSDAEGTKSANPFMRFRGSDRRIANPLLNLKEHATKLLQASQNRYMYDMMVNASRTGPLGAYITRVPAHMIPKLEVSLAENLKAINQLLKDKYGESVDISGMSEDILSDTITFFRPEVTPPRAADGYQTIAYRQPGGKVEFYEVNPRVIAALDPSMPDFTKSAWFQWAFTKPGRVMRVGATTARMAYQLRNLVFRDFFTAWRRGDTVSPVPLLREVMGALYSHGLSSITNEKYTTPWLQLEKSLGIFNSTRAGAAREIEQAIERASGKKVTGVVEKSLSWLENVLSTGEQATRTASMKLRAKQLGITDPTKPLTPEQAIELILAKKRSTTNFQVQGSQARVANLMIPFFTARIAELSQLKQDWKLKPGKQAAFGAAYLTLGIATALANKDEDWWQNLEPEEKATNWMTTMKDSQGNSRVLRIPLETLAGVFHGIGNLIGEQLTRQDILKPSMTEATWGLLKQYIPITNAIDVAGVPGKELLSQAMNYDSFFKKSIVPKGLEEAPPHMQYTAATTELSKGIAGRLHQLGIADWSPARIDHAFRAIFPAGLDMIRSVENYSGVKPINDQATKGEDFLLSLVSRGGYKEATMDRATTKFYELDNKFRGNKDIESPDEETARKKLDKIRTGVSDINVILSTETDPDSRKELYEYKRRLLEQGIAIGEGDTTVSVGFSPHKYKAKSIRKQRKFERATAQASSKQEKSIFSD